MIPVSKAIKLIDRESRKIGSEKIALSAAVGRILAENIVADSDLPPFDRSQMDGYAVVASETKNAPVTLKVVGESAAGHGWHRKLRSGEAVRIMTGAPVPSGADAVQKVELTHEVDSVVTINEAAKRGQNIVRRGEEIKRGKRVVASGEVVTENMIAVLASFGYARVSVGKRPRVAILATGSEIVDIAKRPGRDQIRNSNSAMLDVLCRKFGAETTVLPMVGDDIAKLKSAIKSAVRNLKSEILIVTGGVSVGKYDHTKAALNELGAEIFFEKVCLKPGKPAVFARLGKTLIFGLPGNPVSAAVTFHLFVRRAILNAQRASFVDLKRGAAVLAADAKAARDRDTYLPARLETNRSGQLVAIPLRSQGSSDFVGFARADSLIFIPKGKMKNEGDVAEVAIL
ncbi:MAG: gephyrin-like molybdotransferase Glp [Pyrinomonadaceae bacterium]